MFLHKWKITQTGKSSKLTIPTNFMITAGKTTLYWDKESATWKILVVVSTYKDNTFTDLLENDDFDIDGIFDLGKTKPTGSNATIAKNQIEPLLTDNYGTNWELKN